MILISFFDGMMSSTGNSHSCFFFLHKIASFEKKKERKRGKKAADNVDQSVSTDKNTRDFSPMIIARRLVFERKKQINRAKFKEEDNNKKLKRDFKNFLKIIKLFVGVKILSTSISSKYTNSL